jgi:uncharacterized protein YfaS (alpha-2-macroglobulin family)
MFINTRSFRRLFRKLFGSFHWERPKWLVWLLDSLRDAIEDIARQRRERRRRFNTVLAAGIFSIAAGGTAYLWYQAQPKPVRLSVSGNTLRPTPLREDARPEAFVLTFGGSAAPLEAIGQPVTDGITLSPAIDGEWRWTDDHTLVFTVADEWPIGREIKIELSRTMFPRHVHLQTYEYLLRTPEFSLSIQNLAFYQDPRSASEKKVVAEVHFSHPVDQEVFSGRVEFLFREGARERGRMSSETEKEFTVTFDDFFGKAYIHTETLTIPDYDSRMRLQIGKGVVAAAGGPGTSEGYGRETTVPGMLTHFRVTSADLRLVYNDEHKPEQVLVLQSTAGINSQALSEHLEVYVLPRDRPALPGTRGVPNYRWSSTAEVSQQVVDLSQRVELEAIPTEFDHAEMSSYKYSEDPNRDLYIRITRGLTSFGDYRLPDDIAFIKRVPTYPVELRVMAEGALLSLSGQRRISVLARDLDHVRYRVRRLLPGQIAHFVSQSSGLLGSPRFNNYRFNFDNITQTYEQIRSLPALGHGETQYDYFDFGELIDRSPDQPRGLFQFIAEGWDPTRRRQRGPQDTRFILVTDLGLLVKNAVDGSRDLFVQSISSGTPVPNASISVVGKNGLPVLARATDMQGHLRIPPLTEYTGEREPVAIVASAGQDLSFIPLDTRHVRPLDYSRADIGGVRSSRRGSALEAVVFSDRGIYRPGETANIAYILKDADWRRDLSSAPLRIQVRDPKGSVVRDVERRGTRLGLDAFDVATAETWPTGTYQATLFYEPESRQRVQVGATTFSLEEFLPDRLRITAQFSLPVNKGWLHPDGLAGRVTLQNLFGTAAQNRRIVAEMALSPTYPSFYDYREWQFHDPLRAERQFSDRLGETLTDDSGEVEFALGLDRFESASYLLRFFAEGFEPDGGRSVLASNATLVSPLPYMIGYKPQGPLAYVNRGSEIGVDFIAVDPDLEQTAVDQLTGTVIARRPISTLVRQADRTYKYETVIKEYALDSQPLSIAQAGTSVSLNTDEPGDFVLSVTNAEGLELTRVPYTIVGEANLDFTLEKNAELQITLDKSDYDPGDPIQVSIRAPYVGAGLITIERERVFAHRWFRTANNSTVQTITLPQDVEGNAYVNVTFVRSLAADEIFMSPLSTGVVPFSINKDERINRITLGVPELARPGEQLNMSISTAEPGKAVVFAVDEGILQVAQYQTPDPLNTFLQKRALEVTTQQILDLILPEFAKLTQRRASEAGGAASLLGRNLNPFKRQQDAAVAYWSGVIDVGPDDQALSYDVPDYFAGELRVMAVAVSQDAMDAAQASAVVRGHFVIQPNTPTFVAPEDQFTVSVGVSNNADESGPAAPVQLSLETSDNITLQSEEQQRLTIDEGGEVSTRFDVVARALLGSADFHFTASHQDKQSRRRSTTSVRPAVPYVSDVQLGFVAAEWGETMSTPRRMYDDFRTNTLTVSKLPMALSQGFVDYLGRYPYGCTEQVLSKAFPSLVLGQYEEYGWDRATVAADVQRVSEILAVRQLPDGGFVKWPGQVSVNAFHTAYAVHYLTEANDRGHRIPRGLMERALEHLKEFAERQPASLNMARVQAYAAYLMTRNGMLATRAITGLEQWLGGYGEQYWRNDILALYLASSYDLMQATEQARRILTRYQPDPAMTSDYEYGVFDDNVKRLTHLYLLAKHFPERLRFIDGEQLNRTVSQLAQSYNTTSSALAVLAFVAYGDQVGAESIAGITAVATTVDGNDEPLRFTGRLFPTADFPANTQVVTVTNETNVPAFYSITQAGFDLELPTEPLASGIEVHREFVNDDGTVVTETALGEELTVRLRARTLNDAQAYNVALVDLLPGGFEVVLQSVNRRHSAVEYVDVREDRVLVFGNYGPEVSTYEYRIKAINRGQYTVPPIYAESMYDMNLRSRGTGQTITVR